MTVTKRVYVLMLSLIIVLSGCLGGTTDGQEEDGGGDIINNNYWNNTTEIITELPERIALGGYVVGDASGATLHNYTTTINTTAGQMLEIVDSEVHSVGNSYMVVDTECQMSNGDTLTYSTGYFEAAGPPTHDTLSANYYLGGSAFDCTHTIDIIDGYSMVQNISWSFVYSIHPVTVG